MTHKNITKRQSIQFRLLALLACLMPALVQAQKTVRYELHVRDTLVKYAGEQKRAIAVNGQIPMPTLEFTEGDMAEITVHNHLKESTSLHWHGIFLPNKEDGVPFLTQMPIGPGDLIPTGFQSYKPVRIGTIRIQAYRSK